MTREGVKIDPSKIAAIGELKPPRDLGTLQQVLGLFQYYTRFHPQYVEIATPMTDLTKKGVVWSWSTECQVAFDHIKRVLTIEPFLMRPDFSKPFVVQTGWSPLALGAILAQEIWDEEQQLNREVVICYASKKLRGPELHYSATEGECQAALWAIKLFRPYLYGRTFELHTDHMALRWLLTCRDLQRKRARWSLKLQAYNFDVFHKKGQLNRNVDAFSRLDTSAIQYWVGALACSAKLVPEEVVSDEIKVDDSPQFWEERRAYVCQQQLQASSVSSVSVVGWQVFPTNMVHVWEDTTDWDIGGEEPYERIASLAAERIALTEEELLEVFVSTLPELALHQLLSDQLVEDSSQSEQGTQSPVVSFDTPPEEFVPEGDTAVSGFAAWSSGGAYTEIECFIY